MVIVTYRELAPAPELRDVVRAFFSFTPGASTWSSRRCVLREVRFAAGESFCAPLFADGHASLVADLGASCGIGDGWTFGTPVRAQVIGPLRMVGGDAGPRRAEMIGVFLKPGATSLILRAPSSEVTDLVVDLDHFWGADGARLAEDLAPLEESRRVDLLETLLLERARRATPRWSSVDVAGLARWVRAEPSTANVGQLAEAAGVSRQHLTR